MPRTSSTSHIPTVISKSYPHSKLVKILKKLQQLGLLNIRRLLQTENIFLAYFNQKPSVATQNVEKTTASCAEECATKGKLTLSVLRTPSLDHILKCDTCFEHTCLHLILSDYLFVTDVENLNKNSKPFAHFHKMLSHVEPNTVFKLFQDDLDYASQTSIPIEHILKFLFLEATYRLYVPSIMCSVTRNCTAS